MSRKSCWIFKVYSQYFLFFPRLLLQGEPTILVPVVGVGAIIYVWHIFIQRGTDLFLIPCLRSLSDPQIILKAKILLKRWSRITNLPFSSTFSIIVYKGALFDSLIWLILILFLCYNTIYSISNKWLRPL